MMNTMTVCSDPGLRRVVLAALMAAALLGVFRNAQASRHSPPEAPAATDGTSDEALRLLAEHVSAMVESGQVVGCEVHVIKDGRTVLHEAYGWADREETRKLETGSLFCIRSMTKPVTGTVAQMLIDEGRLSLGDRVARYLPAFDRDDLRDVTLEQLLTHTSGLPLTALVGRSLDQYASLADVAAEAAKTGLSFEPGSRFQYSDSGTDTLGAVIEAVTGKSMDEVVTERVLRPLSMADAVTLLRKDDERTRRVPSAYSGGTGSWLRHWSRGDEPLFPLFLASQSLYCTTSDYAKLLTLWMQNGVADGKRLLSQAAVRRATAPGHAFAYPVGFKNAQLSYGQLWMLLHEDGGGSDRPVAFGHGGSDGTLAWAWPKHGLIVLVFTQSRGAAGLLTVEPVIDQLLIRRDIDGYRTSRRQLMARAGRAAAFEGLYWDAENGRSYYALRAEGDRLIAESPGRFRIVLTPCAESERYRVEGDELEMSFEASGTGAASAIVVHEPSGDQRKPRHVHDRTLPRANDVLRMVRKAHGIEKLARVGPIRLEGKFLMPDRALEGQAVRVIDDRRSHAEVSIAGGKTSLTTLGDRGVLEAEGRLRQELEGVILTQALLNHPAAIFGAWDLHYDSVEVMRRLGESGQARLLVRTTPDGAPGSSRIVDIETGRVVGEERVEQLPGVGFVGLTIEYSDFRDVGGITLPFRTETQFAHPLLPRIVLQYDSAESGASDAVFQRAMRTDSQS